MPRRTDLYARWALETRRAGFFHAGERVGVAVSAGPDSTLLLDFMRQFAGDAGLRLAVVHFNHQLRGAESDADEAFVRDRARELNLDCFVSAADTARAACDKRRNLEATARELRYRSFYALVAQGKLDKIATGHTANDQAETVLLRLLRGTGARGLGGTYPLLDGKVARPFLGLTRSQIEAELERRKLEFRRDSSNRDPRFARNRIRLELLPLLERRFNPHVVPLLCRLADRARDEEAYLEQAAGERARPWKLREEQAEKIPVRRLVDLPPALERRVLRQMIAASRGHLRAITHTHIESLRQFVRESTSGKCLSLPGGCEARREFDWLALGAALRPASTGDFTYQVLVPGEVVVGELRLRFRFEVSQIIDAKAIPDAYTVGVESSLDPDRLTGLLLLRNWRPGDRFQPPGKASPLKLKDLLRERKIGARARHQWPVVQCGEKIVWARGLGASADVSPSGTSTRILTIEVLPLDR